MQRAVWALLGCPLLAPSPKQVLTLGLMAQVLHGLEPSESLRSIQNSGLQQSLDGSGPAAFY